jgi:hypothetical protein
MRVLPSTGSSVKAMGPGWIITIAVLFISGTIIAFYRVL